MTTRLKRDVSDADRADVLTADSCRYCGDLLGPFEVDHIRPLSRGGTNARTNLGSACVSCNTQKSNMLLHEWRQWRVTNGMAWPPIASHGIQPVHFRDGCTPCRLAGRPNWQAKPTILARDDRDERSEQTPPYVVGIYECSTCGNNWRCWWLVDNGYYSDCPCTYCVACRLEDEA